MVCIAAHQLRVVPERAWRSWCCIRWHASAAGKIVISILVFFAWRDGSACINRPRELSKDDLGIDGAVEQAR